MAKNITARFDEELVEELDAVSDVLGLTLSELLRIAARKELERVRSQPDYPALVEAEKERQRRRLAVLEGV